MEAGKRGKMRRCEDRKKMEVGKLEAWKWEKPANKLPGTISDIPLGYSGDRNPYYHHHFCLQLKVSLRNYC